METEARWRTSFGAMAEQGLRVYDELMVPRMFEPWGSRLLELLEVAPGEAVLDAACGPGSVTRIAAQRVGPHGRAVGCDLSAAMLAIARAKPPPAAAAPIEYREGPAERLPVDDADFDAVTCQQALQFFPERPAAVAEMRRALRPGGRVGIAVWSSIERSPPFCALALALDEIAGAVLATRYRGGPFGLPDAEPLRTLLIGAGFGEVRVVRETLPVVFEDGARQVVATLAVTPLASDIAALGRDDHERLVDAVARRSGDGPITSDLEANIALAVR